MDQLFDKTVGTRPDRDMVSAGNAFGAEKKPASRPETESLASQSLFGNAAVAASPPQSVSSSDFLPQQFTFGNAAVAQSVTAPPQLPVMASPVTVTATVIPAEVPAGESSAAVVDKAPVESPQAKPESAKALSPAAVPKGGAPPAAAVTAATAQPVAKPEAKGETKAEAAGAGKEKAGKAERAPAKDKGATEKAEAAPPSPREAVAPAIGAVHRRAAGARKHSEPAKAPVDNAQAAAIKKSTEQERTAATATVQNLDTAKDSARNVQRDDFKTKLKEAIKKATPDPKSESEAKDVMKTGGAKASSELRGQLASQQQEAVGPLKSAAAPGAEASPAKQDAPAETKLQPEQVGAPPAPVSAAPVVPAPLPPERLDYSSDRESTDQAMAENNVTKEQLEKGNEPEFKKTMSERSAVEKHEAEAEARYRKGEVGIQGKTYGAAQKELGKELAGMHGDRSLHIGNVATQQSGTKEKDAKERQRVTGRITEIKNKTRADVEGILNAMETTAVMLFDLGLQRAEGAYESTFEKEKGGAWNWLTNWGSDWEELIERSLKKARVEYFNQVNSAIDQVADFVDGMLKAAKARVTSGLQEVENFVNGLDGSVKQFGKEALDEVTADFESMTAEIDQRRDNLVNALVDQYKASFKRMEAMEEKLREENKSLWQRIYDATVGLIKKIIAFKDMLMNILAKAAEVVVDIIMDPIGFLGNLVDGVKLGVENFSANIATHLKQGLISWLFGTMAEAGIQLPETFDLKGIIGLVLQILGLTYSNIRARAVTLLGEKVVSALETAAEIFKILITEGPAGLWEYVVEKVGDIKAMILQAIEDFIIEQIIKAGILWIVSLLNPASAFFKACKAIYDIIKFFIERAAQIAALVEAIVDSVASIAKGAIGVAAKYVEDALAKAIPVVIGLLASLLGISGITDKIKEIIEMIRKPINAAIDWVIQKAVDMVKAVGGLLGIGKKKEEQKEPVKTDDPEHDLKVEAGLAAIDQEDAKHLDKQGNISRENAEQVAHEVKKNHPIFKTLTVVEGKETWDYAYSASAHNTHTGGRRSVGADQQALEKLVAYVAINYPADGLGRAKGPSGHIPKQKLGGPRQGLPATSTLPGGVPAYQAGDHRGHLIGDRFGGQACDENLVPMHPTLNLSDFKTDENKLAKAYEDAMNDRKAALLHMHVIPKYPGNDKNEGSSYRPESIKGTAKLVTLKKNASPPEAETADYDIGPHNNPDSGSVRVEVNFNTSRAAEIAQLPGIGEELARRIVAERNTRRGHFWEYQDIWNRVEGIGKNKIDKILKDSNCKVRLRE